MRAQILFLSTLLCLQMACSSSTTEQREDKTTGGNGTGSPPAENPYGDVNNCPTFANGTVGIKAGGLDRTLEVELPANPNGAPVVFAWHWLGGNATQILDWMQMRSLADDGFIVIAPEASGTEIYEWDNYRVSDDNVDLQLLDKTLPCLFEQYAIDHTRVHTTGHSAGGLMTSFLTLQRADVFASTAPFSGGVDSWAYSAPSQPISSLVTWGGPSDTYGVYSFHDASLNLVSSLADDGSYPISCEHTLGHNWPPEAADMASQFFSAHQLGQPSDWMNGIPGTMPSFCSL